MNPNFIYIHYISVKPVVRFNLNYRVNSSCLHLTWNTTNIGTCTGLAYHIQYLNSTGGVIHTTHHLQTHSHYTYCTGNITGIKDTRIRAAFNGVVGDWGKTVVSLVAPTFHPPTVSVAKQTGSKFEDLLSSSCTTTLRFPKSGKVVFVSLVTFSFIRILKTHSGFELQVTNEIGVLSIKKMHHKLQVGNCNLIF